MKNKNENTIDPRRNLPSVSVLLETQEVKKMIAIFSRPIVLDAINETLNHYRESLKQGDSLPDTPQILQNIENNLFNNQLDRIRPVVNATGIILHTGLGRAVLPQNAVDSLSGLNKCCNLQIDLETGLRGKRNYMTEFLLCKITGAEAAMVVNNNAAATFLILSALCKDKEVVVSRGQLIEIGGSFRLPDCISQSGAKLIEVGTTNKTHLRDYETALSENTAAILKVNPSNYRIVGFTKEVSTAELVSLKEKRDIIIIDDLGCGALVDLSQYGLPKEPTVQEGIAAGADIVCFSGDKLISGPQSGIIVGKKKLIDKIKKHPLSRMLRAGKLTDTALEQTLRLFLEPEKLIDTNPTIRMLALKPDVLKKRAEKLIRAIKNKNISLNIKIKEGESEVGGGSLPDVALKTYLLEISHDTTSADKLNLLLRKNEPPIIARISENKVVMDMRTLLDGDDEIIVQALKKISEEQDVR